MPRRYSAAVTALIYAAVGGVWIVGSDALLALFTVDPQLAERIQVAKGIAFVALSGVLLFLLLRAGQNDMTRGPLLQSADGSDRGGWRTVPMLGVLVLILPLLGTAVFALYAGHNEQEILADLRIIADAKTRQIENWLAERRGDAAMLKNSRGFVERVMAIEAGQDGRQAELVRDRLAAMQNEFGYASLALIDPRGRVLVAVGEPDPLSPDAGAALVRQATAADTVEITGLHADPDGGSHLHISVGLTDGPGGALVAVLLMEVEPEEFLFPLVREWPVATRTGEAYLVHREGDAVVNLSALRHRAASAPAYRWPLDQAQYPAVAAVRSGKAGAMRGVDYREVRVLAAWRPVAGTAWYVVAKIDRVEALAAARAIALWVTAVTTVAVVLIACALLLLVRQQRRAQQLALQVQADRLFKQFFDLPFIGMAVTSAVSRRWLNFNDHLCSLLGYTRDELLDLSWLDLTHPDDRGYDAEQFARLLAGEIEGYVCQKRYLRKDGSLLHAHVDVKCVRKADATVDYFVVTIEDISERQAAQAKILTLNRLYRTLSECSSAIVHCRDEREMFAEICRAAVESGGMKMAWVGLADTPTAMLQVAAAYGDGQGYLDELAISTDAADPRSHGPTGTAARTAEPIWCQDFMHDARTARWHASGARFGWGASAALPLQCGGRPVGALTLYTAEPYAFEQDVQILLLEIARAVSFGLDNFAREAARQQSEAELRESEDRYRALFDNSQDAIMLAVPGGRILAANEAAGRMFRCSAADLIGKTRDDLVDTDDPRFPAALAQVAATGSFSGEATLRRRDGERFPAEVFTSLFRERSGELRASAIVRDLTVRKRTEAGLERRARQQQLIAAFGHFALSSTSIETVFARAAGVVGEGLDVPFSKVLQLAPDGISCVLVGGLGWAPEWLGRTITSSPDRSQIAHVIAVREAVVIDDFAVERRFTPSDLLVAHGIVSSIDVLIGDAERVLGVLGACSCERRRFATDDVSFLDSIANTLSTAYARKRAEEHLAYLAQHDLLTGLPNRLLLTDRLTVALARAQRNATRLAVLFLNLDRFKTVNEVFGHEQGDLILREIANRLTSNVRAADSVSRHGGDEFILVLADIDDEQDAARVARKLIAAIAEPIEFERREIVLTVSIGIAFYPDNGDDAESLLRNAGAAMHAAKHGGRNSYGFYSADMNAFAHERLALELDLRRAIEREQLFVVYQPQLALSGDEVIGVEALVRWRHPTRGVVPPLQFIPIAEDSGLINSIGTWVLESACRQHAIWVAAGRCRGTVAVNVSVQQLRQADFVDTVAAVLARTGLPGANLELELTESVVMQGVEDVLRKLKRLAALGIKLAIDDFGTGYSSLSYLQQFPIHRLKIDKSFTNGLPHDRESTAIAEAIISMGHSLGLDVLAEGVETTAQRDHLRALGCDAAQGYLYAKPVGADECGDYLAHHARAGTDAPQTTSR